MLPLRYRETWKSAGWIDESGYIYTVKVHAIHRLVLYLCQNMDASA